MGMFLFGKLKRKKIKILWTILRILRSVIIQWMIWDMLIFSFFLDLVSFSIVTSSFHRRRQRSIFQTKKFCLMYHQPLKPLSFYLPIQKGSLVCGPEEMFTITLLFGIYSLASSLKRFSFFFFISFWRLQEEKNFFPHSFMKSFSLLFLFLFLFLL